MARLVARFLGWASVPCLVLALAASDAEAEITAINTTNNNCDGSVTWSWDGTIPDEGEFEGTKWHFSVEIKPLWAQFNRIEFWGRHETSACHAGTDDVTGDLYFSNLIALPAAGSGATGFPTTETDHAVDHSDKFACVIIRPPQGNSTIACAGEHQAKKKGVPAFGTWGLLAFVILLLVAGSTLLRRQRSSSRAVTAT